MRKWLMAITLAIVACEGPTGPAGPSGPAGPAGSLTRYVATATVSGSGSASVALPAAAGNTSANPPGLECYLSNSASAGVWLNVTDGDGSTTAFCGLALAGGVWNAQMIDAPPGWAALFIATW